MAKLKKKAQTSRKSTGGAAKAAAPAAVSAAAAALAQNQMASLVAALAANTNLYLNPLLMNNPLMAAALLQQQQLGAAAAVAQQQQQAKPQTATRTPAARLKSRSVSNESVSSAAAVNRLAPVTVSTRRLDETASAASVPSPSALTPMSLASPAGLGAAAAQAQPAGLKLVLKRQSGDKYEVKPSSSADSTTSGGRPKREAARRVKFVFNEYESDMDYSPEKKRNKLSWSSSMPSSSPLVSPFSLTGGAATTAPMLGAPFRSFSSSLDSTSSQQLFQKAVLPGQANLTPAALARIQNQLAAQDENVFVDEDEDDEESGEESDDDDDEQPVIPFTPSEIIRRNFSEKVKIVLRQPKVCLRTSRPFQIVLVESQSNIICTKAILYIHLFQSYTAQCITCLSCGEYLTIGEFSKHLHKSEDDDDEDFAERMKQTFKVLPYRGKDKLELNKDDLEIWKLFGIRYAKFKQEHLARLKQQKEEEALKLKLRSASTSRDEDRPGQFKNWDQVSEDRTMYMIDKSKLIYNEVVCASDAVAAAAAKKPKLKPLTRPSGRLSDHDDSDSDTDSGMDTDDQETTHAETPNRPSRTNMVDDLSLSEDESEAKPVTPAREKALPSAEIDKVPMSRTDTVDTVILSENSEQTLASLDASKTLSSAKSTAVSRSVRMPSRREKYVNLYDNMSQANLMYICDNEFTIIPDSYVDYINSKRESNQRNIKLAETSHFQKIWLSMCLDLELECRRVPSRSRALSNSISSPASNRSVSILSSNDSASTPGKVIDSLKTIDELVAVDAH